MSSALHSTVIAYFVLFFSFLESLSICFFEIFFSSVSLVVGVWASWVESFLALGDGIASTIFGGAAV